MAYSPYLEKMMAPRRSFADLMAIGSESANAITDAQAKGRMKLLRDFAATPNALTPQNFIPRYAQVDPTGAFNAQQQMEDRGALREYQNKSVDADIAKAIAAEKLRRDELKQAKDIADAKLLADASKREDRFKSPAEFKVAQQLALTNKTYPQFYANLVRENSPYLDQAAEPSALDTAQIQAILKADTVAGATAGFDIAKAGYDTTVSKANASNAGVSLEQNAKGASGEYQGIPKDLESRVQQISTMYRNDVAANTQVVNSGNQLLSLLGDGSKPVGGVFSVAAINQFNKTMDPGAVVRKEDYEAVAGAGGYKAQLENAANKIDSGVTLGADEVKQIIAITKNSIAAANAKLAQSENEANQKASLMHLNPIWVTGQRVPTSSSVQIGATKKIGG